MVEIIPAILPKNLSEIGEKLGQLSGLALSIQIDFVDGVYAPNTTWPYTDEGVIKIPSEFTFPHWDEFNFEADLMISDPLRDLDQIIHMGFSRIVVHPTDDIDSVVTLISRAKDAALEVGLAIHIDTPVSYIEQVYEKTRSSDSPIDYFQCMGIAHVGFQGQTFDEDVLNQIAYLKQAYPGVLIAVDGAVNRESAPKLISAGVSRLIVGSALFTGDSIEENMQMLLS